MTIRVVFRLSSDPRKKVESPDKSELSSSVHPPIVHPATVALTGLRTLNTAMKIREVISPDNTLPNWILGDFYHGTARRASSFHPTAVAYFTSDPNQAHEHALADAGYGEGMPQVVRVKLGVRNPAVMDEREMQDLHFHPEIVARLQSRGYDSAIGPRPGEIAVFGNHHIHIKDILRTTATL